MSRIVLFGATGYTGELTARAMAERGLRPLLAARDPERTGRLGDELGLETATAEVGDPAGLAALLTRGDVLVSTVGPFRKLGATALEAAIAARAHYIDSTGEPAFVREVFEEWSPRARRAGIALVPACGYDNVPGHLAASLALRAAPEATRVAVGYFVTGRAGFSTGTMASGLGATADPHYRFTRGRLVTERAGRLVRDFSVNGRTRTGLSMGASEHLALPRQFPHLREVEVYLGWFGSMTKVVARSGPLTGMLRRLPGTGALVRMVAGRSGARGPDAEQRSRSGSHIVAIASGRGGKPLATVRVHGIDAYDFTARMLAWTAERALHGQVSGSGALGPAEAFGVDALLDGCRDCGMAVQGSGIDDPAPLRGVSRRSRAGARR